jgi:hypothetical protein
MKSFLSGDRGAGNKTDDWPLVHIRNQLSALRAYECKVRASGNQVPYQPAFERLRVFRSGRREVRATNTWEIFPAGNAFLLLTESGIFNDYWGFRTDLIFDGKIAYCRTIDDSAVVVET